MADRVLRDHTEPCEHKTDYPDGFTSMVPYYCGHWTKGEGKWCPGGREVTIDYEAARKVLQSADEADRPYFTVRAKAIVDAALRVA